MIATHQLHAAQTCLCNQCLPNNSSASQNRRPTIAVHVYCMRHKRGAVLQSSWCCRRPRTAAHNRHSTDAGPCTEIADCHHLQLGEVSHQPLRSSSPPYKLSAWVHINDHIPGRAAFSCTAGGSSWASRDARCASHRLLAGGTAGGGGGTDKAGSADGVKALPDEPRVHVLHNHSPGVSSDGHSCAAG